MHWKRIKDVVGCFTNDLEMFFDDSDKKYFFVHELWETSPTKQNSDNEKKILLTEENFRNRKIPLTLLNFS